MGEYDQARSDAAAPSRDGVRYVPRHAVDPNSLRQEVRVGEAETFHAGLHIVKSSNVHAPFPSLEVSKKPNGPVFMMIDVTLDYKLCFQLYPVDDVVQLTSDDIMSIYAHAAAFLPEAILLGDPVIDAEQELRAARPDGPF